MEEFLKVEWPESQKFFGREDCFYGDNQEALVPREVYFKETEKTDPNSKLLKDLMDLAAYFAYEGEFDEKEKKDLGKLCTRIVEVWHLK